MNRIPAKDIPNQPVMPCPGCGKPVDQGWIDVTVSWDPEPMVVEGRWSCHTEGCQYTSGRRGYGY